MRSSINNGVNRRLVHEEDESKTTWLLGIRVHFYDYIFNRSKP